MSAPIYIKVSLMVLFYDVNHADYYRAEADKINVDLNDDESDSPRCVSVFDESKREEKRRLLSRADELDWEELPNTDEIYEFLCSCDQNVLKPRFVEMIDVVNCFRPHYSNSIYIQDDEVWISFVTILDPSYIYGIEEMECFVNEEPFFKSRAGGRVGNYCNFPSRVNPEDQLGELSVSCMVFPVTDITGKVLIEEEEEEEEYSDIEDLDNLSDSGEEEEDKVKHPFFMTHEQLFGEPQTGSVDLDEVVTPPKQKWSKRFVPKPIRSVFKTIRAVF
jgi:hypothetical protein